MEWLQQDDEALKQFRTVIDSDNIKIKETIKKVKSTAKKVTKAVKKVTKKKSEPFGSLLKYIMLKMHIIF